MIVFFRRLFALVISGALIYALFIYGVSDINSRASSGLQFEPLSAFQIPSPLLSADAMTEKAETILADEPEVAEKLALNAMNQNPSSGMAVTLLHKVYVQTEDAQKARSTADLAGKLWPSHSFTRSQLADFWILEKNYEKVIQEWNVLLIRNRGLHKKLFPQLSKLIQNPDTAIYLQDFIKTPPVWWDSFFLYLAKELSLDSLTAVYGARLATSSGVTSLERKEYVNRLLKEKMWSEAYNTWFFGLTPSQEKYTGLIFDGGFESNLYNQGFSWHLKRSRNPVVKLDITYGIRGRRALRVSVRNTEPVNFQHVSQILMLEQGEYELQMRFRSDNVKSEKGLQWRLRCQDNESLILGESPLLNGSNPWSTLYMKLDIPFYCKVQVLRLESASRFRHERFISGTFWFDEIKILNKREEEE